jgi:hypothetical protein
MICAALRWNRVIVLSIAFPFPPPRVARRNSIRFCWLLTGRFAPRASIVVMKVSNSLSDVACSLSYIYFAVE